MKESGEHENFPINGPKNGKPTLFRSFLKDRKGIGSLFPTSRFGVRKICDEIDFDTVKAIVECGPGTGVITEELLRRMPDDSRLILIEQNAELAEALHDMDPRMTVIHDTAERVQQIMEHQNIPTVDIVVTGIPFSSIPKPKREIIIRRAYDILRPGGSLIIYQFRKDIVDALKLVCGEFSRSTVWLNIPPLDVYTLKKEEHPTKDAPPEQDDVTSTHTSATHLH